MGFSEPIISIEDDPQQVYAAPAVKGVTPAVPEHSTQFVVALDYISGTGDVTGGTVGPACLMGLAWVKVNWTFDGHDHVKVAEGETKLQSDTSGIKPIWIATIPEDLPADVWALILIGGGSSGGTLAAGFGIVTEAIGPATGDTDTIAPGSGKVQLYDTGALGVRTKSIANPDPVDCYNYDPGETYEVNTGVYMASSAAGNEVISAFCATFDEPEE